MNDFPKNSLKATNNYSTNLALALARFFTSSTDFAREALNDTASGASSSLLFGSSISGICSGKQVKTKTKKAISRPCSEIADLRADGRLKKITMGTGIPRPPAARPACECEI